MKISFKIIVLVLILSSFFISPVRALVTDGICSDEIIALGVTCTATGFRLSDLKTNVVFKVLDIDLNPPYHAEIEISAYWDELGLFPYDEIVQAGNTYIYNNPSDSNDFVRFTINSIYQGNETSFVEFGNIEYQQTSYVGSGGSDSNSGKDTSNKWATLSHATSIVQAGEDVVLLAGTIYETETAFTTNSGLYNAPIIYRGTGINSTIVHYNSMTPFEPYAIEQYPSTVSKPYHEFRNFSLEFLDKGFRASDHNIYDGLYYSTEDEGIDRIVWMGSISNPDTNDNVISNSIFESNSKLYIFGNNNDITGNDLRGYTYTYGSGEVYIYNNTFPLNSSYLFEGSNKHGDKNNIGNYWVYYPGIDANGDKIGDTALISGTLTDNFPKMDRESGYIKDISGNPIEGAYIYDVSFINRNDTSDETGYYAISTTGRPTVSFGAYKEGYDIIYDTFDYDSSNANFTLVLEGGINNVSFSATENKTDYISEVYFGQSFYVNTWINNSNYDPNNDSYFLRYKNPSGTIIGQTDIDQIDQTWLSLSGSQPTGIYTYEIWSYRLDRVFASNTLNYINSNYILFDKDGKTNDNNINVNWYISSEGWESEYMFAGVDYWYTQDVYPAKEYELVINVTPQGFGNFSLKDLIIARDNFSGSEVMLKAYLLNTLNETYTSTDFLLYQNETVVPPTPTPTITPIPTPTITPTPLPTPTPPIEGNDTGTGWQGNYSNLTQDELNRLQPVINGSFGLSNQPLGDLKTGIHTVNQTLSSSSYQGYMTPLLLIVPPLVNAIPNEIKALWTLYIVFLLILIILGRD